MTVPNLQMGVHFAQAKNLKQKLVYYQDVQLVNILSLSKVSLLFYKSKNLVNMIKKIFSYTFSCLLYSGMPFIQNLPCAFCDFYSKSIVSKSFKVPKLCS